MPPREALASLATTLQGRRPETQTEHCRCHQPCSAAADRPTPTKKKATTTKSRAGAPDILVLQIKSRSSAPLTMIEISITTN